MNRNKVQSFRLDELENRLAATKQRMARYSGQRFAAVLAEEIELIEDVIANKEYVPSVNDDGTPHNPHIAALATKLQSPEHQAKVAAKVAAKAPK